MEGVLSGLFVLMQPEVLVFLTIGIIAGLFVGATPGVNDNIAFAVFLPFVFAMDAATALAFMIGIYCASTISGAIPAIVLKVPGTVSSLLTAEDGNAMARKGRGNEAIGIAVTSSVVGGIASALVLIFLTPILAAFALRFGPAENFALGVFAIASVIGMMSGSIFKGILAAAFGLLIAMIGFHHGTSRYTFGNFYFFQGIPIVPLLVGLFGVAAVLELVEEMVRDRRRELARADRVETIRAVIPGRAMLRRLWPTWLRSSAIGNLIGVIPGAGALIAIYLSYDTAARSYTGSAREEAEGVKWGDGVPEGVAAPECANNAVVASSMVPVLALGIPGNSVSALFIAAMELQGLTPGPLLFQRALDIAWMVILAFFLVNLLMGPIAFLMVRSLIRFIYAMPKSVLATMIAFLCLSGAYAVENTFFGIWVALGFGVVGYVFRKTGVPIGPVILAVILGERIENSFFNALQLAGWNWWVFFDPIRHPISLVLLIGAALFLATPLFTNWRRRRRARRDA